LLFNSIAKNHHFAALRFPDFHRRWYIENENNNTLKTKSYNFKHNFGHGKQHLSSLLASLNILAFLVHTVLEWFDQCYALVRNGLSSRKTFFDDIRALTRYMQFDSVFIFDFPPRATRLNNLFDIFSIQYIICCKSIAVNNLVFIVR
jgi:hypothetical protein